MKAWTAVKAGIFIGMTVAMLFHWHVEEAKAEPLAIVATDSTAAPAENIFSLSVSRSVIGRAPEDTV